MEKYSVDIVLRGIDPRIKEKINSLVNKGKLEGYIEDLIISKETGILEERIIKETTIDIENINRKVEILERKVKELEERKVEYKSDDAEKDVEDGKNTDEFEDDAVEFINNLMSI